MKEIQDMNRRPQVPKPTSAIEGFLQTKQAEVISPNALINYRHHLGIFSEFIGLECDRQRCRPPMCAPASSTCGQPTFRGG